MKTPEPVPVLAPWLRTAIGLALLVLTAMFAEPLIGLLPPGLGLQAWLEPLRNAAIALAMFAGAHLVHSLVAARLAQPEVHGHVEFVSAEALARDIQPQRLVGLQCPRHAVDHDLFSPGEPAAVVLLRHPGPAPGGERAWALPVSPVGV